jgi:hypothetical protein
MHPTTVIEGLQVTLSLFAVGRTSTVWWRSRQFARWQRQSGMNGARVLLSELTSGAEAFRCGVQGALLAASMVSLLLPPEPFANPFEHQELLLRKVCVLIAVMLGWAQTEWEEFKRRKLLTYL